MLYVIQEINGRLVQLRKELERMKQSADCQIVQTALASVQALIKKPPELFLSICSYGGFGAPRKCYKG